VLVKPTIFLRLTRAMTDDCMVPFSFTSPPWNYQSIPKWL